MTVVLENDDVRALVNEHGAELCSLVLKKTGADYIWSGDAAYWGRHAPVLFPTVGKLKDDTYFIDGRKYSMHQHGFARDMDFSVVEKSREHAVFELKSDEKTRESYPFDFVLKIAFTLDGPSVRTEYVVENPGETEMHFGIGAHPAFSTQLEADDRCEDYVVEIRPERTRRFLPLDAVGLFDLNRAGERDISKIAVSREAFSGDAVVFCNDGRPVEVTLKSRRHDHQVTLYAEDTLAFGVWSCYPKEGQYVCLEPWWSIADTAETDQDFRHKYGIRTLEAGGTFHSAYKVTIR